MVIMVAMVMVVMVVMVVIVVVVVVVVAVVAVNRTGQDRTGKTENSCDVYVYGFRCANIFWIHVGESLTQSVIDSCF